MARGRNLLVPSCLAQVGAVLCLVAVLLGPSQIIPGLLALGAALEGSHTVRLGVDQDQFHLVLSHERGQTDRPDYESRHRPQPSTHHHGPAAGVLCFLAGSGGLEPDHVANFTIGSAGERRAQASTVEGRHALESFALPFNFTATCRLMVPAGFRSYDYHGPPERIGLRELLRSTVLLV